MELRTARRACDQPASVKLAFGAQGGPGSTVVCLPMFCTSRAMTAAGLSPALSGAGLRELYVDLFGHGDSP